MLYFAAIYKGGGDDDDETRDREYDDHNGNRLLVYEGYSAIDHLAIDAYVRRGATSAVRRERRGAHSGAFRRIAEGDKSERRRVGSVQILCAARPLIRRPRTGHSQRSLAGSAAPPGPSTVASRPRHSVLSENNGIYCD